MDAYVSTIGSPTGEGTMKQIRIQKRRRTH